MRRKLSFAQREVLHILSACPGGFAEPGEIWQEHSSYQNVPSPLGLHNFGITMDALSRRSLVVRSDHGWEITDDGRKALEAA
jgi:hypothetical protein